MDPFTEAEMRFPGCEIVVSNGIVRELRGLANGKGRHARYAKAAEGMLGMHRITVIGDSSGVDDWIIEYASENGALVCTNDSRLKGRLKARGAVVLGITRSGDFR